MTFYSATYRAHRPFQKSCLKQTNDGLYLDEMKSALGRVIIKCADFFTCDVQPILTPQGLAYSISQYASNDVIIVRDNDFPELQLPDWCNSELLPLGFRKAAALSEIIHNKIVQKYHITDTDNKDAYIPQQPYEAYLQANGLPMPLSERLAEIYINVADAMKLILIYAATCAIVGAAISIINNQSLIPYTCSGALLGAAYAIIQLLTSRL